MAKSVIDVTPGEREDLILVDGIVYPGRMPLSNIQIISNEKLVHDPSHSDDALPVEKFDIEHEGQRYVGCLPYLELRYEGNWSVYHCTVDHIEILDSHS